MGIWFILIAVVACFVAGMGIGGGSIFIMLGMIFLDIKQIELQGLNLVMFIAVGITATISNFKAKKIDKKLCFKLIPGLVLGSLTGLYFVSKIDEEKLRFYFLCFMAIIGIYEIISSLITLKKEKNNTKA